MRKEKDIINELNRCVENNKDIRAMILTSSLTNPKISKDILSDYDIIFVVTDIKKFIDDDTWRQRFGNIINSLDDKFFRFGLDAYVRCVLYDDGVKIDFSIWPVEIIERIIEQATLPEDLNIGYRVLLDKDGITAGLKQPTYSSYITTKPTEEEYIKQIKEFWWDLTYVAKCLWRDELFFAKYMLDYIIRFRYLKKIVEWYIGIQYDWTIAPGKCGRWLKRYLDTQTWSQIEATFSGANIEENWLALFNTTDIFRRLAIEIGEKLGFDYDNDLDKKTIEYLLKIKNLDKDANDFA